MNTITAQNMRILADTIFYVGEAFAIYLILVIIIHDIRNPKSDKDFADVHRPEDED